MTHFVEQLELSRQKLLASIDGTRDLVFLRGQGNLGDDLIYAGIRQLLRDRHYRELSLRSIGGHCGETAIVAGGGSWCAAYSKMPEYLPLIESRFENVIVFPSSFDTNVESVRAVLSHSRAMVFAREQESYRQIRDLCRAELAYDCAFYFDFAPYRRTGTGVLNAFRTDHDALPSVLPAENNDISRTCSDLDDWLWTIARHQRVRTDRAHVTVAAAMLGKTVQYRATRYHKVPGIVHYSLQEFPVEPLQEDLPGPVAVAGCAEADRRAARPKCTPATSVAWWDDVTRSNQEIEDSTGQASTIIIADEDQLELSPGRRRLIRFPERGGVYWGPPDDDETARREFHRLLDTSPDYFILAWPCFWWRQQYPQFWGDLRSRYECVLENERLIILGIRGEGDIKTDSGACMGTIR